MMIVMSAAPPANPCPMMEAMLFSIQGGAADPLAEGPRIALEWARPMARPEGRTYPPGHRAGGGATIGP
jgi:hypothetical protein